MTHILKFDSIIFASPVYWYAVSPPMKTFIDRISDLLEVPELLDQGRRLRGKTAYVVCTSIYDEPPRSFIDAFKETFCYLGMNFGGYVHANCDSGYVAERYENEVRAFVHSVRELGSRHSLATD
jgi:multimeric flavodoxin WrbA